MTQRGAISIGRRLQDPLAELVKIEPKAIGVGMYQHDVDRKALATALDRVVVSCVNFAGVDANVASAQLLRYVSGVSSRIAEHIVAHRAANGLFTARAQLQKVAGLGPATFEQAAGFLKIAGGKEPLDNTFIHPESYDAASALLARRPDVAEDAPSASALARRRLAWDAAAMRRWRRSLASRADAGRHPREPGEAGLDPRDALPPHPAPGCPEAGGSEAGHDPAGNGA